jgi:NADH-quinone oxidoreductase subunit G
MPKVTIDSVEYEARPGQTVIQLIYENNLDLPHFCWHPGLTVAGNCRMCLVEIEKMPKLAIACATTVSDGMVVNTKTQNAVKGREDVMEFLLINHPLDCPICDEAGQCKLQDYAFNNSRGISRFEEEKVHKDKRVPFGPNVLFDGERCISCSRCIRFSQEIADQPVLTFVERGDHVTIEPFPGTEFDNPYSMNVIDICPVGALTSRDFRFKARAWDMSFTDSTCPSCARGCNIRVGVRDNEILRLEPRANPNVNDFWMCDHGRLSSYPPVNAENRISGAKKRVGSTFEDMDVIAAASEVAKSLRKYKADEVAFIASPYATLEDNFVFAEIAKAKGIRIGYFPNLDGEDAKLLIRADKTPNAYSMKILGIAQYGDELADMIAKGAVKAVYALEDDFLSRNHTLAKSFDKLEFFAAHATNESTTSHSADIILPAASWAEKEGVFINFEGWVNRLKPAVETKQQVRGFDHMSQSRLDKFASPFDRWAKGRKVDALESWRLAQMVGSEFGKKSEHLYTEDVFEAAAGKLAEFKGMDYEKLGKEGLPVNGIGREIRRVQYVEVYQQDTVSEVL